MKEAKVGEGIFLLRVRPGTAEKAIREIRGKPEVSEAQPVLGTYDLVVTGAFKSLEGIQRFADDMVNADFCEDCTPSIGVEEWKREVPQAGEAAAWTLIKAQNPRKLTEELRKLPVVNAVYSTVGPYNVIARLAAKSPRDLQDSILKEVHALPGVRRTESLATAGETTL